MKMRIHKLPAGLSSGYLQCVARTVAKGGDNYTQESPQRRHAELIITFLNNGSVSDNNLYGA